MQHYTIPYADDIAPNLYRVGFNDPVKAEDFVVPLAFSVGQQPTRINPENYNKLDYQVPLFYRGKSPQEILILIHQQIRIDGFIAKPFFVNFEIWGTAPFIANHHLPPPKANEYPGWRRLGIHENIKQGDVWVTIFPKLNTRNRPSRRIYPMERYYWGVSLAHHMKHENGFNKYIEVWRFFEDDNNKNQEIKNPKRIAANKFFSQPLPLP